MHSTRSRSMLHRSSAPNVASEPSNPGRRGSVSVTAVLASGVTGVRSCSQGVAPVTRKRGRPRGRPPKKCRLPPPRRRPSVADRDSASDSDAVIDALATLPRMQTRQAVSPPPDRLFGVPYTAMQCNDVPAFVAAIDTPVHPVSLSGCEHLSQLPDFTTPRTDAKGGIDIDGVVMTIPVEVVHVLAPVVVYDGWLFGGIKNPGRGDGVAQDEAGFGTCIASQPFIRMGRQHRSSALTALNSRLLSFYELHVDTAKFTTRPYRISGRDFALVLMDAGVDAVRIQVYGLKESVRGGLARIDAVYLAMQNLRGLPPTPLIVTLDIAKTFPTESNAGDTVELVRLHMCEDQTEDVGSEDATAALQSFIPDPEPLQPRMRALPTVSQPIGFHLHPVLSLLGNTDTGGVRLNIRVSAVVIYRCDRQHFHPDGCIYISLL